MFSRSRCKNTTRGIAGCFIRVCFAQKARKLRCSRDWIRHGVSPIRTRLEVGEGDAADGWGQGVGEREKRDQAVSRREGRGALRPGCCALRAGPEKSGPGREMGRGKGYWAAGCRAGAFSFFLFLPFPFYFIFCFLFLKPFPNKIVNANKFKPEANNTNKIFFGMNA